MLFVKISTSPLQIPDSPPIDRMKEIEMSAATVVTSVGGIRITKRLRSGLLGLKTESFEPSVVFEKVIASKAVSHDSRAHSCLQSGASYEPRRNLIPPSSLQQRGFFGGAIGKSQE